MMYPYSSYSYSIYGSQATFLVIAILAAIILGVVLYFTFLNKKNEGKYNGAAEKIYNFFNFNKFYVEDVMKLLYIVSTAVLTVIAIVILFTQSLLGGILILIIGNVALRISYELIMMFIILCRKTVSVDKKLDKITKFYGDDFDGADFDDAEINDCESCCAGSECCGDGQNGCAENCSDEVPCCSEVKDAAKDDTKDEVKESEADSEPKESDGGEERIKASDR